MKVARLHLNRGDNTMIDCAIKVKKGMNMESNRKILEGTLRNKIEVKGKERNKAQIDKVKPKVQVKEVNKDKADKIYKINQ